MKNTQKGFAPVSSGLIIAVLLIIIVGIYFVVNSNKYDSIPQVGTILLPENNIEVEQKADGKASEMVSVLDLKVGEKIKSLTVSSLDTSDLKYDGWFVISFSGQLTLSGTYKNYDPMGEAPFGDVCFDVATTDLSKLPDIKEVKNKNLFCFSDITYAKTQLKGDGTATIVIDNLTYGVVPKGGWRSNAELVSLLGKK